MTSNDVEAVLEFYGLRPEESRLASAGGRLEFERTKEIASRYLPPPPAKVADIGGGTGAYTLWLADQGYEVAHRDLVPRHVEQMALAISDRMQVDTAVADARDLDLADATVDAAFVLGPLYHLEHRADRVRALREAQRIVRPGSPVFVAAISRWMPRIFGNLARGLEDLIPGIDAEVDTWERSGWVPPLFPGWFSCYTHRPGQLRAELRAAGLDVLAVVSVEGPAILMTDLDARIEADASRDTVLRTARALESVPELIGLSPHLLAIGRRPHP